MSGRFNYPKAIVTPPSGEAQQRVGAQLRDGNLVLRWPSGDIDQVGVLTATPLSRTEWTLTTAGGTYTVKKESGCGCR